MELADATPKLLALRQFASMDRFTLEALCCAQAQPLYLGDNSALCRVLSRYKLLLDTRDLGFAAHVLLDGYWEMWLTIFMCRHIQPGMVAIDVGANFGYYTVLMADLVGPEGHVFAVEPNPVVAALLQAIGHFEWLQIADFHSGGCSRREQAGSKACLFAKPASSRTHASWLRPTK